jgi:hypothetical protein
LRYLLVGAAVGLCLRLLLAAPADLFARVLGGDLQPPGGLQSPPGSLGRWLQPPHAEAGFLKLFVLATWWVGGLLGVGLVWRRGGRWTDVFCGAIAGAGAGLAGSATLGCLLIVLDALPRALLALLARSGGWPSSPWLWTPVWIGLAAACWAVLGGGLGFVLGGAGRRGARVLAAAAAPFAWLFRACGLSQAADFFALQG